MAHAQCRPSHTKARLSLPADSAWEQQSDRNRMTPVGESWDCWAGSRTVWTSFVRRGRGGFGSEAKEIVSSSLGSSVDFRVCHRGARSGPSLTRLLVAFRSWTVWPSRSMVNLLRPCSVGGKHAPTCRSLHVPLRRHPQRVRGVTPQFSADNLKCSSHCPVTLFRSASPCYSVLRSATTRGNGTSLPEIDAWPQGWTCVTRVVTWMSPGSNALVLWPLRCTLLPSRWLWLVPLFPSCSGCWAQSGVSPHLVACMQQKMLRVADGAFDTLQ